MNEAAERFADALKRMPLVAILRGVKPDEAIEIGGVLLEEGWTIVEVPLNSPQPFDSIAALSAAFGDGLVVGAGTVVEPQDVAATAAAGGRLVVAPNFDAGVVSASVASGLAAVPGVFTPTEAFAALKAGAHALKLFPAEAASPAVVKAMLAVLPRGTTLIPVGGIAPESLAAYWQAGARGFGIGSALYKPGMPVDALRRNARFFVEAVNRHCYPSTRS